MIFNDKMVETGGFPNDGLGGLTAGVTYYFKGRGFRTAPKEAAASTKLGCRQHWY